MGWEFIKIWMFKAPASVLSLFSQICSLLSHPGCKNVLQSLSVSKAFLVWTSLPSPSVVYLLPSYFLTSLHSIWLWNNPQHFKGCVISCLWVHQSVNFDPVLFSLLALHWKKKKKNLTWSKMNVTNSLYISWLIYININLASSLGFWVPRKDMTICISWCNILVLYYSTTASS